MEDFHSNTRSYANQEAYERFARQIAACARLKLLNFLAKFLLFCSIYI